MLIGRIKGHGVYKVQSTELLPLQERQLRDPDEDVYISLIKTHLRTGPMYFSYTFDLTNSFQRQANIDMNLPLWKRTDDRFFWNRYIQSDLIDLHGTNPAASPYILPVIFGFLKIVSTRIKDTPFTYILITRKSRHRAGTRYFTRGVDENGNVANYNETEQAVILGDTGGGLGGYDANSTFGGVKQQLQVLSYVQTRGSVPVYWAEINHLTYTPKLIIKSVESAIAPARKHFDEQIRLYGDNYCVNLVNQKGREEKVKRAYETLVRNLVSFPREETKSSAVTSERFREIEAEEKRRHEDRVHYVYFDFHHECRNMRWHRAELLLDQLANALSTQRYFHSVESSSGTTSHVVATQTSVIRTNCMDCLDRTNVVQSMLARWALTQQLRDVGVLAAHEQSKDFDNFEFMFRNAWADNADVVSRAYSGTGALKTDFTRTGNRTYQGALADLSNSITRYFRNNFADGPRQDAYDLFLGTYMPAGISSSLLFIDRRPLVIQAVPYVLAASVFLLFMAIVAPRSADASQWAWRVFVVFWLAVLAWSALFVKNHGMFYVSVLP